MDGRSEYDRTGGGASATATALLAVACEVVQVLHLLYYSGDAGVYCNVSAAAYGLYW